MLKKPKYSMNIEDANNTLQNVFAELNMTPNSVPFDKIVLRGLANTILARTCRYISLLFLILTLLSPLAFINKEFVVSSNTTSGKINVVDHQLYADHFTLVLQGNTINYNEIYARMPDGSFVFPLSANEDNGTVDFPYAGTNLNIYIPDINGNVLQAVLSK